MSGAWPGRASAEVCHCGAVAKAKNGLWGIELKAELSMAGKRAHTVLLLWALLLWASMPFAAYAEPMTITPSQSLSDAAAPGGGVSPASLREEASATRPTEQKAVRKGPYNLVVLGDSLGDGLWAGLYHVLRKDKQFRVIKKSKVATGLVRHDYYNWNEVVQEVAADMPIDIAVVVMGTNDRQAMIVDGKRYARFSPEWEAIYARRVEEFVDTLKATGAQIYWMELPVMRSPTFDADMQKFNRIFEEETRKEGIRFVRTRDLASDENGAYEAYGADRFGRKRLLRAEDGVHFSMAGYELLGKRMADRVREGLKEEAPAPVAVAEAAPKLRPQPRAEQLAASAQPVPVLRVGRSDDWRWLGRTN